MNFRLRIEPKGYSEEIPNRMLFSFAVVDLDKSKSYPQNFVCMLPMRLGTKGKTPNAFQKIFGEKSHEQAKALLTKALRSEDDPEIKAEIERRLSLLEPKKTPLVKCSGCGKSFAPKVLRRFHRKFCPECMVKKYGNRE